MGLSHDGFKFLKGSFEGLKGYTVVRITKSHHGKVYIDDAGWGPEASSIEYGYRAPFGGIHVFIGKIGELGPEPDICTDNVETAQRARPARFQPAMKRAFVGVIHGGSYEDGSEFCVATVVCSGDESSTGETESLYQLQDGRLAGCSDGNSIPNPYEPPNRVAIFMIGTQLALGSTTAAAMTSSSTAAVTAGASGSARPSAPFGL